jgi:hypothetical protein
MRHTIRKILLEDLYQKRIDFARKTLFKMWDKEKSMGKKPKLNSSFSHSLGVVPHTLNDLLIEWYGGIDVIFQLIKDQLDDKIITTDDLTKLGIDVGGYDFSFKLSKFRLIDDDNYFILMFVYIIDGGVNITDGSYVDLTDIESIDNNLWWELSYEIKDLCGELVNTTIEDLGLYDNYISLLMDIID